MPISDNGHDKCGVNVPHTCAICGSTIWATVDQPPNGPHRGQSEKRGVIDQLARAEMADGSYDSVSAEPNE